MTTSFTKIFTYVMNNHSKKIKYKLVCCRSQGHKLNFIYILINLLNYSLHECKHKKIDTQNNVANSWGNKLIILNLKISETTNSIFYHYQIKINRIVDCVVFVTVMRWFKIDIAFHILRKVYSFWGKCRCVFYKI